MRRNPVRCDFQLCPDSVETGVGNDYFVPALGERGEEEAALDGHTSSLTALRHPVATEVSAL